MDEQKQDNGFNLDGWLAQGKNALGVLHGRKRSIAENIVALHKEETEINKQISAIEAVFGAHTPDRRTGVIDLCREVVTDDTLKAEKSNGHDIGWTEDNLVQFVLERDPFMKDNSIRNALRSIAKKGELERIGKRGSYRYRRLASDSGFTEQVSPREKLSTKLISVGKAGLPIKNLAWVLGDEAATLLVLDEMMGDGTIETFPVGEGVHHYRLRQKTEKAEPEGDGEVPEDLEQGALFGGTVEE